METELIKRLDALERYAEVTYQIAIESAAATEGFAVLLASLRDRPQMSSSEIMASWNLHVERARERLACDAAAVFQSVSKKQKKRKT